MPGKASSSSPSLNFHGEVKNFELISFATGDELARNIAGAWLDEIAAANRAVKPHCVALSGGRITQKFFSAVVELLREGRRAGDPDSRDGGTPSLPHVHFFWADERCVPPSDAESNFKMADELLFRPLGIAPDKIHRIRGEDSPAAAVKNAGAELSRLAAPLDLIFLGMGEDGHIASLFPNASSEILHCAAPYLAVTNSPKPPPNRVSLSYAAIVAARQVWVLASGPGKAAALAESLAPQGRTPLARVLQSRERTVIFTDIGR